MESASTNSSRSINQNIESNYLGDLENKFQREGHGSKTKYELVCEQKAIQQFEWIKSPKGRRKQRNHSDSIVRTGLLLISVSGKITAFNLGTLNFWWKYFTDMLVDQMLTEHVRNFTVPAHTFVDIPSVKAAYEDVRSDHTDTKWAVFKYEGTKITVASKGTEFDEFKELFGDAERCYGYIRLQTGDEMSKRTKFILITWVGKNVGVMHRAKVTNDKSIVKEILTSYAAEFQLESSSELDEGFFVQELSKIGGTKYGTGVSK